MCHVSHVTCHVSRVTCHVSNVKIIFFLHFPLKKKFVYKHIWQSSEASWWRVFYQRGLPRLVFKQYKVQDIYFIFICVTDRHFIYCMIWRQQTNQNNCKNTYVIFTNLAPLGRVGHSRHVCMCVVLSVCLCHRETPTSGDPVDLWSKIAFLILV